MKHSLMTGGVLVAALVAFAFTSPKTDSAALPGVQADPGEEIYMTRCMSCHQANGEGISGVFPPLAGSDWVTGDKGRLIRIVLHGVQGEFTVKDVVYSGAMPPWHMYLDDAQAAALITYVRTSWDNDSGAVTAGEVAAVRAHTKDRKTPYTQAELETEAHSGVPGSNPFGMMAPAKKDSTDAQ